MNNDHKTTTDVWREIQREIREARYKDAGQVAPRVPKRRQMAGIEGRLWSFLAMWLAVAVVLAAVVWLV